MALTLTEVGTRQYVGSNFLRTFDITFDSSYATGGEAIVPGDVGFVTSIDVFDSETIPGTTVRSVAYDRTNGKLLAYNPAGTEITNTTNLSAITVRCRVWGR